MADKVSARTRITSFDYLRQYYHVPAARGLRVSVDGQPGRITRGKGPHIMVRFDDVKVHGRKALPCHPTCRVVYHVEGGDQAFGMARLDTVKEEVKT